MMPSNKQNTNILGCKIGSCLVEHLLPNGQVNNNLQLFMHLKYQVSMLFEKEFLKSLLCFEHAIFIKLEYFKYMYYQWILTLMQSVIWNQSHYGYSCAYKHLEISVSSGKWLV